MSGNEGKVRERFEVGKSVDSVTVSLLAVVVSILNSCQKVSLLSLSLPHGLVNYDILLIENVTLELV